MESKGEPKTDLRGLLYEELEKVMLGLDKDRYFKVGT